MLSRRVGETALGVALLALTVALAWQTRSFPPPPAGIPVGSATYPRGVLAVIGLMSIAMIVQVWRAKAAQPVSFRGVHYVIGSAILFGAYVKLAPIFGYFPVSAAYLVLMLPLLKVRSWSIIALTSILYLAFVYVFFVHMLGLPLPAGTLTLG